VEASAELEHRASVAGAAGVARNDGAAGDPAGVLEEDLNALAIAWEQTRVLLEAEAAEDREVAEDREAATGVSFPDPVD
jgi:hypothetical protein